MRKVDEFDRVQVVIPCHVGCLRHVIGITYFEWVPGEKDQPELYFETLHRPWERWWKRLHTAFRYVVFREPIGVDSTLIGATQADRIIAVCNDYKRQHELWVANKLTPLGGEDLE